MKINKAYPLDVSTGEALKEIAKGIPSLLKLLFRLVKDKETPTHIKLWIVGTAIYIVSPLNLSLRAFKRFPFKIINYVDDIALILLTIQKTLYNTPKEILEKYWDHSMSIEEWTDLVFKIQSDIRTFRH
ncbi:MAG: hypothetical protein PF551_05110 [Candidatus Marinimicrobia bacterium]|jgi:uncharacterized membrane protein YkvA (DUF1232 family)|nr:hypothetical protein [Candidatus Neomarinimicrobiota bacterium]